jgi:biotin-(acetyl-CoA carboxylase) ligase
VLTDICEQFIVQKISSLPKRQDVASMLLVNIVSVCQNFQLFVDTNFELFSSRYDFCKGKNVEIILDDNVSLSGVAQGINENAELTVMIEGRLQVFNSAEVSVKAMNGENS